jgi:hypothetical protein
MAYCSNHNKTGPTLQGKPNFSEIANFGRPGDTKPSARSTNLSLVKDLVFQLIEPQCFLLPVEVWEERKETAGE